MSQADPYGTAQLRAAVLTAWRASPRRLREDAAVEDDVARGQYTDRVVVELLQNAADAAARARTEGRVVVELQGGPEPRLQVSNTGAPLTAEGVAALASMRTSDKDLPEEVGQFGVGFAAVRAVADVVTVASCDGAVRFDTGAARELLAGGGGPLAELDTRSLRVPALRLPFPDTAPAAPGFTTTVELELRGPDELAAVVRQLEELDDVLLLALPRLASITIVSPAGVRRLDDAGDRWWTFTATGPYPAGLPTPAGVRADATWSVTWAVPRDDSERAARLPAVVHAPTPTQTRCTLPAILLASFPVSPSRRRIVPGARTDVVAQRAGEAYAELVAGRARAGESPFAFVPEGLPADEVDAAIRDSALVSLASTPLLAPVAAEPDEDEPDEPEHGSEHRLVPPREAVALAGAPGADPELLRVLGRFVGPLVRLGPDDVGPARALGVTVRDLAEVLDDLGPGLDPSRWRELLDAVEPHVPQSAVREALATLPVPLVGGHVAYGPRGLVVLDDDASPAVLGATSAFAPYGMRVVHPEAAHPLLVRLGAGTASAASLLWHDAVPAAIAALDADPEGDPATAAVRDATLELVAGALAGGLDAGRLPPGLTALPLPAQSGGVEAAGTLVLPGSDAEELFPAAQHVAAETVRRWGADVLVAVGVRAGLRAVVLPDVLASDALIDGEDDDDAPEGWSEYLGHVADHLGVEAFLGDVTVVEDLEEVDDDAWGRALAEIAGTPALRAALLHDVRGASGARAPSYASWWLRDRLGAPFAAPGTRVPFLPDAPALAGGADVVAGLDDEVLTALGAVRTLDELDAAGWDGCLDALPEAGAEVPLAAAVTLWRALAHAAERGLRLPIPPDRLVLLDAGRAVVGDAAWSVVADELTGQLGPHVPAPTGYPTALAQLLDIEVRRPAVPTAQGTEEPLPEVLDGVARVLLGTAPVVWVRAPELAVGGIDVGWWVDGGDLFARDVDGLVRAVAYASGAYGWHARFSAALADGDLDGLLVDLARARPRAAP